MSQYLEFYIKDSADHFQRFTSYSRSGAIYQIAHVYAPYGAIIKLTSTTLHEITGEIEFRIREFEKNRASIEKVRDSIATFNNCISEKLEKIEQYNNIIEEYNSDIEEYEYALNFYIALGNFDVTIYFGVEAGENPTCKE